MSDFIERVRAIARDCGYAITVHGSEKRDLDLVAVPWTPEAVSADQLVARLCEDVPLIEHPQPAFMASNPEAKPVGSPRVVAGWLPRSGVRRPQCGAADRRAGAYPQIATRAGGVSMTTREVAEDRISLSPSEVEAFRRAIRHALTSVAEMRKRLDAIGVEFEREAERLRELLIRAEVRMCATCGVRIAPGTGCPPERGYSNWHCAECRMAHDLY